MNNTHDKISAAFDETFELVKRGEMTDGEFLVDGKWYFPKFGCDSLQRFIDILKQEKTK